MMVPSLDHLNGHYTMFLESLKEKKRPNPLERFVEPQGVEPWSEHGYCQAFYMFSRSSFSRLESRSAYLI
jgi:hypothetical protein